MATNENGAGRPEPEDAPESGAPSSDEPRTADEEGWPRSWIVVTSVLAIVAIIVVARIAGRDWRTEVPPPEPPAGGPTSRPVPDEPPPAHPEEHAGLDLRELQIPSGAHCLGKDGEAHAYTPDPRKRQKVPETCQVPMDGTALRVEITRTDPHRELMVRVFPVGPEPPPLVSGLIMPNPAAAKHPIWLSTNQGAGSKLVVLIENPAKEPVILSRARLMIRK